MGWLSLNCQKACVDALLAFPISNGSDSQTLKPKMKIFIDESGSFSGYQAGSIGAVGALAIPDRKLPLIEEKYGKIRRKLPCLGGEVKDKLLNE